MKNRPDFHPAPTKIVQLMGLEPTPKYMDMNLNHARMPIPPQLHYIKNNIYNIAYKKEKFN